MGLCLGLTSGGIIIDLFHTVQTKSRGEGKMGAWLGVIQWCDKVWG